MGYEELAARLDNVEALLNDLMGAREHDEEIIVSKMERFQALLKEFEDGAVEYSWLGSRDPREHADIRKEYELRKQAISDWVRENLRP